MYKAYVSVCAYTNTASSSYQSTNACRGLGKLLELLRLLNHSIQLASHLLQNLQGVLELPFRFEGEVTGTERLCDLPGATQLIGDSHTQYSTGKPVGAEQGPGKALWPGDATD